MEFVLEIENINFMTDCILKYDYILRMNHTFFKKGRCNAVMHSSAYTHSPTHSFIHTLTLDRVFQKKFEWTRRLSIGFGKKKRGVEIRHRYLSLHVSDLILKFVIFFLIFTGIKCMGTHGHLYIVGKVFGWTFFWDTLNGW